MTAINHSQDQPQKSKKVGGRFYAEITADVHRKLGSAAKSCKLTKTAYASAAIRYFTDRGLDPESDYQREGLVIQHKIHDLEKMISTLGNRLFGWLTQHEKNLNRNLFGYMRGHEKTLFEYLQSQTTSLHEHLNEQEDIFLTPLMRQAILGTVEAFYARRITEQIMLKVSGYNVAKEWRPRHEDNNTKRDAQVEQQVNEFLASLAPALTPPPAVPPATPVPERNSPATKVVSTDASATAKSLSDGLPDRF